MSREREEAADQEWMRTTVQQAQRLHGSTVVWAPAERGVPHFSVLCRTCGQVALGVDSAWLQIQAREHEGKAP